MDVTAKIQQKSLIVNEQRAALWKRLSTDGMRLCIFKGQGGCTFYRVYKNDVENKTFGTKTMKKDLSFIFAYLQISQSCFFVCF